VRDSYLLNSSNPSPLPLFSADAGGADLRGFRQLPEQLRIEWERFFPGLDGAPVPPGTPASGNLQPSMRLDTRLAPSLTHPPIDVDEQRRSIALLNLFRGQALGLPSGQDFATAVGRRIGESVHVLTPDELGQPGPLPLWFYLLRGAEVLGGGARLGPVGARVVAEVLIGLAMDDPSTCFRTTPGGRRPCRRPRQVSSPSPTSCASPEPAPPDRCSARRPSGRAPRTNSGGRPDEGSPVGTFPCE
jgi:hypothetical protein